MSFHTSVYNCCKSLYVDGIVQVVKVKVNVNPLHACKDTDGRGRYSSNSFASSMLQGGGWSAPHPGCFTSGKGTVPIVQEEGWPSGLVCMGVENLTSTRIQSSDCPASSESLYWPCYSDHNCKQWKSQIISIWVTVKRWVRQGQF